MLLSQFLVSYSLERSLTDSSIEQYQIAINSLSKHLGREAVIDDLLPDVINLYLRDLALVRSAHTVKSKRRSLMVLWRAVAEQDLVKPPVRVRTIKVPETPRDYWNADDIARLVSVAASLPGEIPQVGVKSADYFTGLILAAWETGLRMADLLRLDKTCLVDGWFSVNMQKTGMVQWCRLHGETKRVILATYTDSPTRFLCWPTWGKGDASSQAKLIRKQLCKIMYQAQLVASDGPFKKLRRSSINAVEAQRPGAGQWQGGHTSPVTTQKWYLSDDHKQTRPMPAAILGK